MSLSDHVLMIDPANRSKFNQWPRTKVVIEFTPQLIEALGTPTVFGNIGRSQMKVIAAHFGVELREAVEIHFLYSARLNIIH